MVSEEKLGVEGGLCRNYKISSHISPLPLSPPFTISCKPQYPTQIHTHTLSIMIIICMRYMLESLSKELNEEGGSRGEERGK